MSDQIKVNVCVGTGAIMNVECGFVPTYVKVFNPSDAGSLWPTAERWAGMAAASMLKTLKQIDSGATGLSSSAYVTTNGLSDFAGEIPGKVLAGTAAITSGLKAITGTSTAFLTDLRAGDIISLGGNQYMIAGVTSATAATIVEAAVKTETVANINRISGRAAGFTLGVDGDLNVAAEGIFCIAMK